jgi:hypothetical protein
MIRALALVIFVCSISLAQTTSAQVFNPLENALRIVVDPAYPVPNTPVRISVQSSAIDLAESTILWTVGTTTVAEGVGITSIRPLAGPVGSNRLVTVEVSSAEGSTRAQTRLATTEIDLLWESDSYTPPFYRGRTLAGTQSQIRMQAIPRFRLPDGTYIAEKDIVYDWYRNDTLVVNASGRGKSTAILKGPSPYGADTVTVRARSGTLVGEARVRIPAQDTPLSLYENHPLFGILYHRALEGGVSTLETEQVVTAVPYFANIDSPSNNALSYEWVVNGTPVQSSAAEPETLTISVENYTGPARIELTVTSAADIVMRAARSWEMQFGSTSIFDAVNPFGN